MRNRLHNQKIEEGIEKLIRSYRFISIFLTLFIYIVDGIYNKYRLNVILLLVLCVIASVFLFNYLYQKSFGNIYRIYLLIGMETLGISYLMLITGGLESPFIWCYLNPLLIITNYLVFAQKFVFLCVNFLLLCTVGYYEHKPALSPGQYLLLHSNIILSYILIFILVNILLHYSGKIAKKQEELKRAYEKLENTNVRINGMINDILSMYEAIQLIPGQHNKKQIVNTILEFAGKVFPGANVFFALNDYSKSDSLFCMNNIDEELKTELLETIKNVADEVSENQTSAYVLNEDRKVVLIKAANITEYGMVGLLINQNEYNRNKNEFDKSLILFSRLGETFFEKMDSEVIGYNIAIAEEQNRIADDIHDSVIQRLFAISCLTYDTVNKWDKIKDEDKKSQMRLVMETIQSSLKDLRSTIYNLSNKDLFSQNVLAYTRDMEKLTGIKIQLIMEGDYTSFSSAVKKAIYRLITECIGNAVKHSKCKNIRIGLKVEELFTRLTIEDDGTGFDPDKVRQESSGLGLYNIKSLVRTFNGNLKTASEKGKGTIYDIEFSNGEIMKKPEES